MNRTTLIASCITLAMGALLGYRLAPRPKPETKTIVRQGETRYVDRVIERTVSKAGEVRERIVEKDSSSKTSVSSTTPAKPQYSASACISMDPVSLQREWQVTVGRRMLGPVWAEIGATSRKEILAGLRVEW